MVGMSYNDDDEYSLGGNKLLLLTLVLDGFGLNRQQPDACLAVEGKLGCYADSLFRLTYNAQGRISGLIGKLGYGSGRAFAFDYLEDELTAVRGKLGAYAGDTISFTYDTRGRMTALKGKLGYYAADSFTLGYDGRGKVSSLTGKLGYCAGNAFTFEYDGLERIVSMHGKTGCYADSVFRFEYSPPGRLAAINGKPGYCADKRFVIRELGELMLERFVCDRAGFKGLYPALTLPERAAVDRELHFLLDSGGIEMGSLELERYLCGLREEQSGPSA